MLHETTLTFLGGGNMAQAMIRGLIKNGLPSRQIRVGEPDPKKRADLVQQFDLLAFPDNPSALNGAQVVVVAVKPNLVGNVLQEIAPVLTADTLLLSIAAGVTLNHLANHLPVGQPLVRVMPNTPALIGAGISVLLPAVGVSPGKRELARQVMAAVGQVEMIENEALMDGVTALSGSGPAYVYLIAEALSDGGVACGLPRPLADRLAVQTLIGSAQLIAESGRHPGELKNQVTSPGGTTIAALAKLEQAGVRGALIAAVTAAWQRAKELNGG